MNYPREIALILARALGEEPFGLAKTAEELEGLIEVPKDRSLGDYAFPCFTLAKSLRKAPVAIAAEAKTRLAPAVSESAHFTEVEAVGPYLNFRTDKANLAAWVVPAILGGAYLARREPKHIRVMIEYSQPNTHKAFHVGHTRNVALGDALVRICEWAGYDVVAANYIGDVGAHIAKCLWYFQNHFRGEVPHENRGEFLGQLYSRATELLDFTTLTRAPHPGVVTARVLDREPHPRNPEWSVVRVEAGRGEAQVVCGGTGFEVGSIVPFAPVGAEVGGRRVVETDKGGVRSQGMILSEVESSLGAERSRIPVFPPDTAIGEEIAEVCQVEGAIPGNRSVIDVMREREEAVASVLRRLEQRDPEITALWRETRQWSLDEFDRIYAWLDARFDHVFYESDVGDRGKEIVQEYYEKGIFVLSEGAIGADLKPYGLPFFLLRKRDGTGLYSTKDLALAEMKFGQFHVDRSVYVVDTRQSLHFQQVFKTLELMGYERAAHCFHLAYGFVSLPEGEISSRTGVIILFSELKDRLIRRIREEFLNSYQGEWSEEEIQEAAKRIAIATIKYGMLNHDSQKNIVFDLEEWTSRTGNTGPYLMYAYTRTRSILREVGVFDREAADWELLTHPTEGDVLRRLVDFAQVVSDAAERYQPQLLCIYLYDLSKEFSRMYDHCSVLRAETPELRAARASLVDATGRVIRAGLELLGIRTLERM